MGKYTDEDGVDGPFNRALRAARRDDAKARLKRMVREGATFVVHEQAGAEVARAVQEAYGFRCGRCHRALLSTLPAELTSGACECGGLIEAAPQGAPVTCAHGSLARSCNHCFDVEESFREGYACACGPTDSWGSGGLAASEDADRAWEQSEAKRRCGNG